MSGRPWRQRMALEGPFNTSFNLRGEPSVNTPQNAFNTFVGSDVDVLVLENFIAQGRNGRTLGTDGQGGCG